MLQIVDDYAILLTSICTGTNTIIYSHCKPVGLPKPVENFKPGYIHWKYENLTQTGLHGIQHNIPCRQQVWKNKPVYKLLQTGLFTLVFGV